MTERKPSSQGLLSLQDAAERARNRRRQRASHARFDRALEMVEKAARAAADGDAATLARLVDRMDRAPVDDFEGDHPPSRALDFLLYDVIVALVPIDGDHEFGATWIDALVHRADHELAAPVARWVRLAVGMATDEFELSNQELEAIERFSRGLRREGDASLVDTLAAADARLRAEFIQDGVQALAWLRGYALGLAPSRALSEDPSPANAPPAGP